MREKFSVLLSVYHKENPLWLKCALESIWSVQTLKPDQIVLVKDGPLTEGLEKVISDFVKTCNVLKIVPIGKNGGLGNALNIGLGYCDYDLVARMDTDDCSHEDRFEKQIAFMSSHEEIDIISSWIQEFVMKDGVKVKLNVKKLPKTHGELFVYGKHRCPINHPACVYRKHKVLEAGGYGVFPEDYYLWSRMMMKGCVFYNMQECLLDFRISEDVFKRRGGWKYLKAEYKCQKYMHSIGYIPLPTFCYNCIVRFVVRLIPNKLRGFIYSKIIRKRDL